MSLSLFFDTYNSLRGFDADPHRPLRAEFNRLASKEGWHGAYYLDRWYRCLESEIREHLGSGFGYSRLCDLRTLCRLLLEEDAVQVGATAKECEQALRKINVNVLELIDDMRRGTEPEAWTCYFPSYTKLCRYTLRHKRCLPTPVLRKFPALRPLFKKLSGL